MLTRIQDTAPGATQLYSAKSALFTAGVGDRGTFFDSTGSFTITIDTTGMSAGWSAWFRTVSGTQTFDPSGGTLINGATTYAVSNAGDVILVEYTGTAFVISQSQLPAAVAITGGTINGTTIGATTATTGRFTTITATALTTGRVLHASTAGLVIDAATLTFDGVALTIGDGVTGTSGAFINGAAGTDRRFWIQTNGVKRWGFGGQNTAESGADSGTNFRFTAYDDSGAVIDNIISCARAAGSVFSTTRPFQTSSVVASTSTVTGSGIFGGGVGIAGAINVGAASSFAADITLGTNTTAAGIILNGAAAAVHSLMVTQSAGVTRWGVFQRDATDDFRIRAYDDAGAAIDYPLTINRASGGAIDLTRPVALSTASSGLTIAKTTGTTLTISSTQASTTTATGALLVAGGVGVAGRLCAGSLLASGLTSGRIPYNSTGGLLIDSDAFLLAVSSTATLTVGTTSAAGNVTVNALATNQPGFFFQTGGVNKWLFRLDSVAESGSDAGANFTLVARTDAGANIDTPLTVARAAGGLVTLARPVSVTSTTDSTSIATGAIVCSGGIGVAKRLTLDGATGKTLRIVNGVANGSVATTITSLGPTGAQTTIQGWMRIDINGTDRYIPYW